MTRFGTPPRGALAATATLVLLVLAGGAWPSEERRPDEAAAEAALAAHAAGDAQALQKLAARDHPDPWLVADVLLARGEQGAAAAFARATTRPAVAGLPAYVATAPPSAARAKARAACAAALTAAEDGRWADVLEALDGGETPKGGVLAVRWNAVRGRALLQLTRAPESADRFEAGAREAARLGWLAGEAQALYEAGFAAYRAGQMARALGLFERRRSVEEALDSPMGVGRAHSGLASAYLSLRQEAQAQEHLQKAQTLARAAEDHEYLAKGHNNATLAAYREGRFAQVLRLADLAVAELDQVDAATLPTRFLPDPVKLATLRMRIHVMAASAAYRLGDEDRIEARRALALAAAAQTGDAVLIARTRGRLASLEGLHHFEAGESFLALEHYEVARAAYEETGDVRRLAETWTQIGTLQTQLGAFAKARESFQRALEALKGIEAPDQACKAHIQTAHASLRMGRTRDAAPSIEAALTLARTLADRALEAQTLGVRSDYHTARTEYGAALAVLGEALALPVRAPARGGLLLRLARLHERMGRLPDARSVTQEALGLLRPQEDAHNVAVGNDLLAFLLLRLGQPEKAFALFRSALPAADPRPDPARVMRAYRGMADVRSVEGRHEEAVGYRRKALAALEQGGETILRVELRTQLGSELYALGRRAEALEELDRAYAGAAALSAPRPLAVAQTGLAEVHLALGHFEEAILWAQAGVETTATLGLDLAEGEGALTRRTFASLPELGARAAWRAGRIEDLYGFLERGRAATLLATLGGRATLREATVPDALRRKEEAARAAEALAMAAYTEIKRGPDRIAAGEAARALTAARQALGEAVAGIQRSARRQSDLAYPQVPTLAAVRARLPTTAALVVYAKLRDDAIALVVRREREPRVVHLGRAKAIRDAALAVFDDEDHPVSEAGAKAARKRLVDPLALDAGVRQVLISPYGPLSYLPFALLVPERDVVLVPSATAYALLADLADAATGRGEEVLALGNPAYDPALASVLPRLEASGEEADDVGDVVLVEEAATETRFRAEVAKRERWRAVHLACHGLVDRQHPTLSSLALGADALNDGYLTVLDVFRMSIPADLAVLSACNTGVGEVIAGEGIMGLTRAFMYAGAPRVLVSLWKVNDQATAHLMKRFYALWNPEDPSQALPAAEALRRAQQDVRSHVDEKGAKPWVHPEYWAAWVLWGLPE